MVDVEYTFKFSTFPKSFIFTNIMETAPCENDPFKPPLI